MAAMLAYRWPGNVRELNSKIEKAVLLCPTPVIPAAALGIGTPPEVITEAPYGTGDMDLDEFQRQRLSDALARTGWNISRTAAVLGVTRNTVRARIARYGLRSPAWPEGAPAVSEVRASGGEGASGSAAGPEEAGRPGTESVAVSTTRAGISPGRPVIAVVPFRVEGEDEARTYFGDGIVEDIVGALASIRDLVVISRSSTLRYRGATVDVRAMGREL